MDFPENLKILVVDDNKHIRESNIKMLRTVGFKGLVLEASDGNEAIQLLNKALESEPVSMMISDYQMPHMNGLQLLKEARANPKLEKMPILLVTTEGDKETVLLFMKNKVTSFLLKPFTPEQLEEKLKLCLAKL